MVSLIFAYVLKTAKHIHMNHSKALLEERKLNSDLDTFLDVEMLCDLWPVTRKD